MSVRSMTGFARVRKSSPVGEVVVTVKSVNHRGLDLHFRMSQELDAFEPALRGLLRRYLTRGHVQVRVWFETEKPAPIALNRSLLEAYGHALRRAAEVLGVNPAPDVNAALAMPGMLREEEAEPDPEIEKLLVSAMEEALAELNAFREREGGELAAEISARARSIAEAAARMERLRERALPALHARLTERLSELLGPALPDAQRIVQEAAVLADRSDIAEELSRLKLHTAQLQALIQGGGEVGKKLDFLLQEMGREANTLLSKTNGLGEAGLEITEAGLEVKAEIEKIREQALNLE